MKFFLSFIFVITAFVPLSLARAAELSIEPIADHEGSGFSVHIVIQYDRPINALEGKILFDRDALRVERIFESPSGVPLWIEQPRVIEPGVLSFAGIFPGGIEPKLSDRMSVMDITFETLVPGETDITFSDVRILLNKHTPEDDDVRVLPITVRINDEDIGGSDSQDDNTSPEAEDGIPPEAFKLYIYSADRTQGSPNLVLFATRDLQTGIDMYEVRERLFGLFGSYRITDSPAELSAMWRWSLIEVRATDRAGNERTARHVSVFPFAIFGAFSLLISWRVRRGRRSRV